jgi:hypothetical protein
LQWDQGTGDNDALTDEWYDLIGYTTESLLTTFQTVENLTPGQYYLFRVRAKNSMGWSEWSENL